MAKTKSITVFHYKDYRKFLKDWYHEAKAKRGSFSYRSFSAKAGFKTSNFLMLVIQGKRNLTEKSLTKVLKGLSLNKQESEFFRNLVFFNQAESSQEKDRYYQNLLRSRKYNELKPMSKDNYEYYSEWYHPTIRELVVSKGFDGTGEWLSEKLGKKVSSKQCLESIALLEKLGFIEKTKCGSWKQASSIVSTGAEVASVVVHNYHKSVLELSEDVLDDLNLPGRDISSLTLGIKKSQIPELVECIRKFRQKVLNQVADVNQPEEVVQLNIQFYPVTRDRKEGGQK